MTLQKTPDSLTATVGPSHLTRPPPVPLLPKVRAVAQDTGNIPDARCWSLARAQPLVPLSGLTSPRVSAPVSLWLFSLHVGVPRPWACSGVQLPVRWVHLLPVSRCGVWPQSLAAAVFAQEGCLLSKHFQTCLVPPRSGVSRLPSQRQKAWLSLSSEAPAGYVHPVSHSPGRASRSALVVSVAPWGGALDVQGT